MEPHLVGIQPLHLPGTVQREGWFEGRQGIAGPRQGEHGPPLDDLPVEHGPLGIGVHVVLGLVVEHDDPGGPTLLGEEHLVAPEVSAVAGQNDLPTEVDTE